jgi:hypothetical protein
MAKSGWQQLLAGAPWFRGAGRFPFAAYSEFMPPPRLGLKPYAADPPVGYDEKDPCGWPVSEWEEYLELHPGLEQVGCRVVHALAELGQARPVRGLSHHKLEGNPAWPEDLAQAGPLEHERHVVLMPLALSRTQDDKGRLRWTLFGGSEQGPSRGFWRGFFTGPRRELPAGQGEDFIRRLLHAAYGIALEDLADLHKAGFRILLTGEDLPEPWWRDGPLPSWAAQYVWTARGSLAKVRFLLTFRPFAALPAAIRRAYLEGRLHLLPCPASLVFWGVRRIQRLAADLPCALQIPLLHLLERHEAYPGLRVPQSGWLHEHNHEQAPTDPRIAYRNTYRRTHRWEKHHRHEDPLATKPDAVGASEDKLAHVLFSTCEDDIGLYGKPMARNAQLWTRDFCLLLDGPNAAADAIRDAHRRVAGGGLFGYRFVFPAMRVGRHEIYWHRPLVAFRDPFTGQVQVLPDAPLGYLTAYRCDDVDLSTPVELWPRPLRRPGYVDALEICRPPNDPHGYQTALCARMLLEAHQILGRPLARSFGTRLLVHPGDRSAEQWLASLPERCTDPQRGRRLAAELDRCLKPDGEELPMGPDTYAKTANRSFEVSYWKTIAYLAQGQYVNKSNADCILDPKTQALLSHHHRDLEELGEYLLDYYEKAVSRAGLGKKALMGDLPFRWQTDYDFDWMGGWLKNQHHQAEERDLIVVIPGRDRSRAVIMADHYDTAFMLDRYDPAYGGSKVRLAAAGADDNHSSTAALMLGAPVFLEMSKRGQLGCDVWLVHLTGEEFPADCLGARHLSQMLVEGRLHMRLRNGSWRDLSSVQIQGVYVLDMVAHNNDKEPDVFQISPGTGRTSLWLAEQAHWASEAWNAGTARWNRRPARKGLGRGQRSDDPGKVPGIAAHPHLRGEVRLPFNPRSTLFNTDGQVFSDAGIPVVLFMENYDINRTGYHDTHDTMANIDLDYGAAVAAIAIESVARAACEVPPWSLGGR